MEYVNKTFEIIKFKSMSNDLPNANSSETVLLLGICILFYLGDRYEMYISTGCKKLFFNTKAFSLSQIVILTLGMIDIS